MKDITGAILFFFICLLIYTRLFGPIPLSVNSVQTTKTDLFQVEGQGSVTAVPDTAQISFGVTKSATSLLDAQNQTNTAVKNILDSLKNLGITTQDVTTTNYSVNPTYTDTQTISGYNVTQNMSINIQPLANVNKAVDALTASGVNLIGQVSFGFTNQKKDELQNQARQIAIAKAKQKAQSLAIDAGVHLGGIINISENPQTPPVVLPLGQAQLSTGAAIQPTQVTPGTSTLMTDVTLSYQIY